MKTFSPLRGLRNISIAKKLYFIVGTMAVLIAIELFTLWFSISTLSSVRAFVGAEGLWSKAQKDASYSLSRYYQTHDEANYQEFQSFMAVPLGDHKTRMELMKPEPDLKIARQGFLEGRNHPDDIDGMISLFRRFYWISYINKAILIWSKGDSIIAPMVTIGEEFHKEVNLPHPSQTRLDSLLDNVNTINQRLTTLEDDFSFTLGEGSRWLEGVILKLLLSIVLTVEITGLTLSITVSRSITKGLNAINKATGRITTGDFTARAPVFSKDEIGQVAISVNKMTAQLVASNEELEAFIYRASHDLKGPLSSTRGLLALAIDEPEADSQQDYLRKMQISLDKLDDILHSLHEATLIRQGSLDIKAIDLDSVMSKLVSDFRGNLFWGKIKFTVTNKLKRPFKTDIVLFHTVMRNIIENAIKYHRQDIQYPEINISVQEEGELNVIRIADNGIGIDPAFKDRIFELFFRGEGGGMGSGLGLYIVKKAMEKLGGHIEVISPGRGQGTTFEMYFPV